MVPLTKTGLLKMIIMDREEEKKTKQDTRILINKIKLTYQKFENMCYSSYSTNNVLNVLNM